MSGIALRMRDLMCSSRNMCRSWRVTQRLTLLCACPPCKAVASALYCNWNFQALNRRWTLSSGAVGWVLAVWKEFELEPSDSSEVVSEMTWSLDAIAVPRWTQSRMWWDGLEPVIYWRWILNTSRWIMVRLRNWTCLSAWNFKPTYHSVGHDLSKMF
jgi:hypothetical protein